MTIDPICGMTVDKETALHTERDGQMHYFCSEHCRKQFLAGNAPANVAESSGCCCEHHGQGNSKPEPSSAAKYFCPMCPGVVSDKPGDCPKCGMALEQNAVATIASASGKTIFTCPMHPEVQQNHLGNCPKCGMALEPKTISAKEEENPELANMTRRFWIGAALALPVFLLAMAHMIPSLRHESWVTHHAGYNLHSQLPSCCGRAGRSSNVAGLHSSPGI